MKTYSLYSDGNSFPRAKKSGFGGYIEAPDGQILIEYTEQIKQAQYIHNFELLGIIRGLQIARSMDIQHIVSYCDDKTTMARLKEIFEHPERSLSCIPDTAKPELYQQIVDLSQDFKNVRFQYIPRSQNKHSDSLSRRYAVLMEQNFLRQYQDDLNRAELQLSQGTKPSKRMFFSHPNMVRNEHKINPFLVSQYRNKKVRKNSRIEQQDDYQFLFIETNQDNLSYKAIVYDKEQKRELLHEVVLEPNQFMNLDNFCQFMNDALIKIGQKTDKLWFFSNSKSINQFFEQKEKIPNQAWHHFADLYETLGHFKKIYYHNLPFKHDYSPEIAQREEKKASLGDSLESVDSLIEQLQSGVEKDRKKYFGLLIRHQLRDYRNLLERELNEIEKHDIIQQTTDDLVKKGLVDLPTVKKLQV